MPNSGAPKGKLVGTIVLALGAAVVATGLAFALFVEIAGACPDHPPPWEPPCHGTTLVWMVFGFVAIFGTGIAPIGWAIRARAEDSRRS